MRLGELRDALGESVRAADLLPNDVSAQLRAGNLLLLARSFEEAKARANAAIALDEKSSEALVLLGNAMAGLRDLDGALAEFQEAVALNPADDLAYQSLGAVQSVRGQGPEAEAAFRKAIEVAPTSISAHMGLANFLWAQGRAARGRRNLEGCADPRAGQPVDQSRAGDFLPHLQSREGRRAILSDDRHHSENDRSASGPGGLLRHHEAVRRFGQGAARACRQGRGQPRSANPSRGHRCPQWPTRPERWRRCETSSRSTRRKCRLASWPRTCSWPMESATKRSPRRAGIVRDEPTSSVADAAYLLIGAIHAETDRPEDAIKAFEEVLKRRPAIDRGERGAFLTPSHDGLG